MFNPFKKRKIDFLIIGAQKAGTSALDQYLRKHPDIGMGIKKEIHFFDDEEVFSRNKVDFKIYESQFDLKAKKQIYGEATPIYSYWKPSCRRIWEYNSKIKLIFILRNPISRAFSHWNMQYDRGSDKKSFTEAIACEKERMNESLPLQNRTFSYVDRGFYSEQIKRFKDYFKDSQIMFLKFEEFKENQESTLLKIFDFLGVNKENFVFDYKEVHNRKKHAKISDKDKQHLIQLFRKDITQVEKLLDWDCSDWLI